MRKPISNEIASDVINSKYTQFDETGYILVLEGKAAQKGSKKNWLWVAATPNAAYYHVDLSRGKKALDKMLKFRDPDDGLMVGLSDAFPVYLNAFQFLQFCCAHLLRASKDLEARCENDRIIHKELSELFTRLKSLQEKLRRKNEPTIDMLYQKIMEEYWILLQIHLVRILQKSQNIFKKEQRNIYFSKISRNTNDK